MLVQYRFSQGEIAELIAGVLEYNSITVHDIAFDISTGELQVIATGDGDGLKVRTAPEQDFAVDPVTQSIIDNWRKQGDRSHAAHANTG